ncbi:hypothetical protein GCM10017687_56950 [Streptomyces echinatus]
MRRAPAGRRAPFEEVKTDIGDFRVVPWRPKLSPSASGAGSHAYRTSMTTFPKGRAVS